MPRALRFTLGLALSLFVGLVVDAAGRHSSYAAAEREYLDACRAAATRLTAGPAGRVTYKRQLDAALRAFDRLPEAPDRVDPDGVRTSLLKELRLTLCHGQVLLERGDVAGCRRLAAEIERRVRRFDR